MLTIFSEYEKGFFYKSSLCNQRIIYRPQTDTIYINVKWIDEDDGNS